MAREQLKNLTEPMYYVLLSLISQNHGYGIMQRIALLTEGRVEVGAGTLYALLGRFEKEEIIMQVAEENRRKIYSLTEKGQGILREEYERLNKMVSDGHKFMKYEDDNLEPPTDTGSGITMPIEEPISDIKAESEGEVLPEGKTESQGEALPKKEQTPEKDRGKQGEEKERKGFGNFGKGRLLPV